MKSLRSFVCLVLLHSDLSLSILHSSMVWPYPTPSFSHIPHSFSRKFYHLSWEKNSWPFVLQKFGKFYHLSSCFYDFPIDFCIDPSCVLLGLASTTTTTILSTIISSSSLASPLTKTVAMTIRWCCTTKFAQKFHQTSLAKPLRP